MSDERTPTAGELRAQLEPWQRQVVEKLDEDGPIILRQLKSTTIQRRDATSLNVRDDGDVRAVLQVLKLCRDLLDLCEWYEGEATLTVSVGEPSALVRDFLKGAVNFSHIAQREAWILQEQIRAIMNWLMVAARHRGHLGTEQNFSDDIEQQLRCDVAPAKVIPPTTTPPLTPVEPGSTPITRHSPLTGVELEARMNAMLNEDESRFNWTVRQWEQALGVNKNRINAATAWTVRITNHRRLTLTLPIVKEMAGQKTPRGGRRRDNRRDNRRDK